MKLKKIQAKPDDKGDKGQKFKSLQPPDISESLKVGQDVEQRQPPKKMMYCRICGRSDCTAPDRIMVERTI